MVSTHGCAAQSATTPLAPFAYEHREPGENDILIDIEFCGICHSDIHQARNELGQCALPDGSGARDCGTGGEDGQECNEVQGRRSRGGRLHGRQLS